MIRSLLVSSMGLLGPAALAAQSGTFVVTLGNDTIAIEQYTRTPERLEGEQVVRSPRTQHRIYTATFGARGAIERFELVTHNVSGEPGPAETKATIEFRGDSAIAQLPRGDSTVTERTKVPAGALPYCGQCYAFIEEAIRRSRSARGDRYTTAILPLGADEPWTVEVARLGRDSATITLGPIGLLRMHVDDQGTLLGLTGAGSNMQVTVERVPLLDFATLGKSFAARPLGQLSPADSVQASIGGASLTVRYNRPSMRGRMIFGGVVPWNKVWRTGANAATTLETSADLLLAGTSIPAGKYSLWTIPSASAWKLIINRNTGQWGTEYDAQHDLVRLDMTVEPLAPPVEQFTIAIEAQEDRGVLKFEWARTQAWIPISRQP
jgi:hypothetical protein